MPAAIEALKRFQPTESIVVGDVKGNLVSCQSLGGFHQTFDHANGDLQWLVSTTPGHSV